MRVRLLQALALVLTLAPIFSHAAQSFSDVPPSREEFAAVEDLKTRGIVEGRPDGTFGPDSSVNRAEAITIVVRAVANANNLPVTKSCFPDVADDAWYARTVCYAFDLDWVSGYPDGTFQPVRTVSKAEFLKILLNAYGVDVSIVHEFRDPLARDAGNPEEWYFPFLATALSYSMTSADSFGNLNPGAALTRGQVALMMERFFLYREGRRTQELLTFAEKDIRLVFSSLDALEINRAAMAAARVRLAVFGASERQPDAAVIRATGKLAEALKALASAYRFTESGNLDAALQNSQGAYLLGDEADSLHDSVRPYTDRVRAYAHDLANDIREYEKE
ncbi:MAG TPA: S-layer homology domain-containing protein [Candidatus Peribacterales bacterium]|nr:S-layer homology domain-containing protein [Candidatus Peribacterales bacterium]